MLRETRMRERIDITDVESATKIRAKYLRALENEEWDLLPGPTFVKTFLRTYGDYLGLDSKLLVEEYKQRFERPHPGELLPFSGRAGGGRRGPRRPPALPPWAIVGVVVAGLIALLALIGSIGDDGGEQEAPLSPTVTATATPSPSKKTSTARRAPAAKRVRLQILPDGLVNVCLLDARGRRLLDSVDLESGQSTRTFRSRRFRVAFGNGQVRMRVNGKVHAVPDRPDPIGFELAPGARPRELGADARPVCS